MPQPEEHGASNPLSWWSQCSMCGETFRVPGAHTCRGSLSVTEMSLQRLASAFERIAAALEGISRK